MTPTDYFAIVRRDELWVRGAIHESRISQGQAIARGREIVGRNVIDDATLQKRLHETCNAEMERLHRVIVPMRDARVRGVVTATTEHLESTVAITVDGVSIVTATDAAMDDYQALKRLIRPPATRRPPPAARRPPPNGLPLVWRNGSAAVLLHEAIGHAAEHGHAALDWPRWLRARDVSRDGRSADLLSGEMPLATRRESFRDVPMHRMTNVVIEHVEAPFELPDQRIEVYLVAGGAYEPMTETVTIDVAIADLFTNGEAHRIPRFVIRASRLAVSRALMGASGDPLRYPGVICSREAQELFVASHAPVMLTAEIV